MILGDRGALYASALLLFTGLEEREELLQSRWGNLREFSLASMSWTALMDLLGWLATPCKILHACLRCTACLASAVGWQWVARTAHLFTRPLFEGHSTSGTSYVDALWPSDSRSRACLAP